MRVPAPWKIAAAIAAVSLALIMSAALGAAAVQRRVLGPPAFTLAFGLVRLDAFTTTAPACRAPRSRLNSTVMCSASQSIYSPDEYFAIWLTVRSRRGGVAVEQARRLLLLHLGERPPGR